MSRTLRIKKLTSALLMCGTALSLVDAKAAGSFEFRSVIPGLKPAAGLAVSPSVFNFGDVPLGQSASASFTVINTGDSNLTGLLYQASANYTLSGNCGVQLAAGAQCTETVTFTPNLGQSQPGTFSISSSVVSALSNLSGTGQLTAAQVSTASLNFGNQPVGTPSTPQGVKLTNPGNTSVTIGQIATSGSFSAAQSCGTTLAPGSSCAVNVTFTPTVPNSNVGVLTIPTSAGTQTVSLSGNGTQAILTATPASLDFSTVAINTASTSQTFALTNSGNVSASGLAIALPAGYTETDTCGSSLAAGGTCSVQVTFNPVAGNAYPGAISISSSTAPVNVSVTGTGGVSWFSLASANVTFPLTNSGTSSTQNLTIINSGNMAGTPTIAMSSNFSVSQCGSIPAGGQCTATLTFTPASSQPYSTSYTGTATVSGSASGTVAAALSGIGSQNTTGEYSFNSPYIPIYSPDQTWYLAMQSDCNLATYHNGVMQWSSGTAGAGAGCWLAVQGDGNLVIYHSGQGIATNAVWSTQTGAGGGTVRTQPTYIQLDNNGVLSVNLGTPGGSSTVLWQN